jgi:hypothetical protein
MWGLAVPLLCGALVVLGGFIGTMNADNGGNALIAKCQESLPRNQICVLKAVPKEVK